MTVATSRTNGFLFADLRDYTRYVERHGDAAAAMLLEAYRTLVRAQVAKFGGAEIKTEGDSFYVVLPSASAAVQCGLSILDAAAERSAADGASIRVGIGVHAGETVETAEGYVGSAVNVAARVCSQARAGELLVTDTVRALTRTFLPVRFVDRRTRRLKGIAEPVTMYRVESSTATSVGARGSETEARERRLGLTRKVRVGVLVLGLFVGGAASGYLLIAAQRPPAGGAASPSAPIQAEATFPTPDEAALLAALPLALRESCVRTEEEGERLGTEASLRCDLGVVDDVDTVWWDAFGTQQQTADALEVLRVRHRPPNGTCSPTMSRAHGNWSVGSTHTGGLMCYQDQGRTWIVWSYRSQSILSRAVRTGVDADDWAALYAWWEQTSRFVVRR